MSEIAMDAVKEAAGEPLNQNGGSMNERDECSVDRTQQVENESPNQTEEMTMTDMNEVNAVIENVTREMIATMEPTNNEGEKMMSETETNRVDNDTVITDTEQIAATNDSHENSADTMQPVEITLALREIQVREALRCRKQEDERTVVEYTERFVEYLKAAADGEKPNYPFPPIKVWLEGEQYVLLGGFHRVAAARKAGIDKIPAIVFQGSADEAFEIALKDNHAHGLRLSSGDKRYSVEKAIERFPDRSLRAIMAITGCSLAYTSKIASELRAIKPLTVVEEKIGLDGKTYTVKRKDTNRVSSAAGSIAENATKSAEIIVDSKKARRMLKMQIDEGFKPLYNIIRTLSSSGDCRMFMKKINECYWTGQRRCDDIARQAQQEAEAQNDNVG